MKKTYDTTRAAKLIGVHPLTLHRWIREGHIRPQAVPIAGRNFWVWTDADIAAGKKLKGTLRPGPKPRKGAKR